MPTELTKRLELSTAAAANLPGVERFEGVAPTCTETAAECVRGPGDTAILGTVLESPVRASRISAEPWNLFSGSRASIFSTTAAARGEISAFKSRIGGNGAVAIFNTTSMADSPSKGV